jgi:phosphotriesterase-related protein
MTIWVSVASAIVRKPTGRWSSNMVRSMWLITNDAERLRWIRRLIDRGHLDQIVISHDICYRSRLTRFGGHGYGHIFENVLPLMWRRGFTEAEIERITVGTPQRLLTFA